MTVLYIVVGLSPLASCFSSEPSSVTERASDDQSPGYRDNQFLIQYKVPQSEKSTALRSKLKLLVR